MKVTRINRIGAFALVFLTGFGPASAEEASDTLLAIWLRADTGVVTDTDGHVVSWANAGSKGSAFDVAPNSGAASDGIVLSPASAGGRPAVAFNGTDFLISASEADAGLTTEGGCWFVVYRPNAGAKVNTGLFSMTPSADLGGRRMGAFCINRGGDSVTMRSFYHGTGTAGWCNDIVTTVDTWQTVCLSAFPSSTPGNYEVAGFVRSAPYGDTADHVALSVMPAQLQVGVFQGWQPSLDGEIAELRFYNRPLTAAERAQVDLELAARYGLAVDGFGEGAQEALAACGNDLHVMGSASGQGKTAGIVSEATSGGLTVAFAGTPAADANSLLAVSHDAGTVEFVRLSPRVGRNKEVLARTWGLVMASEAENVTLTFSIEPDLEHFTYALLFKAAGADSYVVATDNPLAAEGTISFALPLVSNGVYTLARRSLEQRGSLLFLR